MIFQIFFPVISQAETVFNPHDLLETRINNLTREDLVRLTQMGIDIDGVWETTARAYMLPDRLKELRSLGYEVTVIPDRIRRDSDLIQAYHSYSELTSELKATETAHPDICRLYNIGNSEQGRELWFMKITDNPDIEEDEPEVKYISTMHGDEPVGTELSLNLIRVLTDEYGTDPRITALVNEIEIWIMPLMNPDGYMSQSRYNAKGRDLNRSFPDQNYDPNNTVADRPIETQHVMNWAFAHSSVLSANFHTGALVVNYPYDSDPDPRANYSATPDEPLFIELSLTYASLNEPMYNGSFDRGIINGAEWYHIRGGMQDWNYIWLGCNEVTIELNDIKWPPYSDIPDLWNDNRESMLTYMEWSLRGVRGVITDSVTGQPLNATVTVVSIAHDVFTDPDAGDYHRLLLPGTYDIRFSADGYQTQTVQEVIVGSGNATQLNVAMVPQVPGDINHSNSADLTDAIVTMKLLTGTDIVFPVHKDADLNNDGKIGLQEAVYVLRKISDPEN
ncbi:Peptidase M14 domain-containing protein [Desulfonema magnum]|uniref:Peptidase M14 domain-containing protein n=2 Tax=Desulfonema magnum TaxID=45655 RepID=A0A975BZT1_9BACT|nr:Peptidase M14 domain-containing protein [Desulfonema magnum]